MKTNPVGWFEIPVTDMDRAIAFYEKVFKFKIKFMDFGGVKMGWFPNQGQAYGATGCLIQHEGYTPSHNGTLVYLSCDDLQKELDRIKASGGKVMEKKKQISEEYGYMAVFEDSEGNRVALHSLQ